MTTLNRTAQSVFDDWARDHHAPGMERGHWPTVRLAFEQIPDSTGRYLEIGVGNGYGIAHMAKNQFREGFCHGLDISPEMAALTQARTAHMANVRIESGNFLEWETSERFDLIFSMEVFYYFPSIQAGIDKAASLLQKGGSLWLAVNHYQENPESHGWPQDLGTPMQLWSAAEYVGGFERAGLTAIRQERLRATPGEPGTLLTAGVRA